MAAEDTATLRALRAGLNAAQLDVLGWVAAGCPDGRYDGYSHRVSAAALKSRGLIRVSGHGPTWSADLTGRGRALLALPEPASVTPKAAEVRVPRTAAATLLKSELLIAEIEAAGGVLRVPYWREEGQPDYRHRVAMAQRFGKVPDGKHLVLKRAKGGELEIRLEDIPDGVEASLEPIAVPARLTRPHRAAARYRDQTDDHQVSRKQLARSVRILHALAVEAERRGHKVESPNLPQRERKARDSAKEPVPHLVIAILARAYSLSISEEKVLLRGVWEERKRLNEQFRHYSIHGVERQKAYDAEATGRLTLATTGGGYRDGRAASWSDRKSWTLEDELPDVLQELELRAVEDDEQEAEERRQADERQRRWERAMAETREHFAEAHRAKVLRAQIAAREEGTTIRAYLAELEAAHGEASNEWVEWVRAYADRLDPLGAAPAMPVVPEPSSEDLKAFLPPGMSPYGPGRW